MDLNRPMTKNEIKFMVFVVVAVFTTLFYNIYADLRDSRLESKANREACEALDIKVFDAVKVKNDKFYADQIFYAKYKGQETIKVSYPFEDDKDKMLTFYCKDLEKAEDPYAGMVDLNSIQPLLVVSKSETYKPKYGVGDCLQHADNKFVYKVFQMLDNDYGLFMDATCKVEEAYKCGSTTAYPFKTVDSWAEKVECPK